MPLISLTIKVCQKTVGIRLLTVLILFPRYYSRAPPLPALRIINLFWATWFCFEFTLHKVPSENFNCLTCSHLVDSSCYLLNILLNLVGDYHSSPSRSLSYIHSSLPQQYNGLAQQKQRYALSPSRQIRITCLRHWFRGMGDVSFHFQSKRTWD
jgi:hypothetical protein